jgi:hypothetical protein
VAKVNAWSTSYYLSQHAFDTPIDDEAITNLECVIVETDARHEQHVGAAIEIALVCSRRYSERTPEPVGRPALFSVSLRKNQRSLLCYLPDDPYWALPTLLGRPTDRCIEIIFERLHRGSGNVRGFWIGSHAELRKQEEEMTERMRGK